MAIFLENAGCTTELNRSQRVTVQSLQDVLELVACQGKIMLVPLFSLEHYFAHTYALGFSVFNLHVYLG